MTIITIIIVSEAIYSFRLQSSIVVRMEVAFLFCFDVRKGKVGYVTETTLRRRRNDHKNVFIPRCFGTHLHHLVEKNVHF